jgi:hypothetical protein
VVKVFIGLRAGRMPRIDRLTIGGRSYPVLPGKTGARLQNGSCPFFRRFPPPAGGKMVSFPGKRKKLRKFVTVGAGVCNQRRGNPCTPSKNRQNPLILFSTF